MPTVALGSKWFDAADATKWESVTGTLFHVAGQWAILDAVAAMLGSTTATSITELQAVAWLTSHGFDIPEHLTETAEETRLRVS